MYYFRWYAWKKHLVHTPTGYIITEWLPKPNARRLRRAARRRALPPRRSPLAAHPRHRRGRRPLLVRPQPPGPDSTSASTATPWPPPSATSPSPTATPLSPPRCYPQSSASTTTGSAPSRTPTASSGPSTPATPWRSPSPATAIAPPSTATWSPTRAPSPPPRCCAGNTATRRRIHRQSRPSQHAHRNRLWNPQDQFYEVVSPAKDSGIRAQKRFIDPGTALQFSGVRELIGYIPWVFASPAPSHGIAWQQLFDPQGFDGKYRRHHRRAPQPPLPLRLLRPMHLERPRLALRDDANPHRARRTTETPPARTP